MGKTVSIGMRIKAFLPAGAGGPVFSGAVRQLLWIMG
jgi:hypothetical protein